MYNLVDAGDVSKDDFISRNQNIYEGIGCSDIKVEIKSEEKDSVSYSVTLTTLAGEISYDNTARFTTDSEKGTVLVWDDSVIFPELTSTDKSESTPMRPHEARSLTETMSYLQVPAPPIPSVLFLER